MGFINQHSHHLFLGTILMAFLRFLPPARSSAGSPKRCWRWSTSMNGPRNPVDLDGLWPGYHNSPQFIGWVGHDLRWKVSWKSGNITILRNLKSVNVKGVFQRLGLDLDWLFWKALTNDWRQSVRLIDVCFTGNLIFVFFVGGLTCFLNVPSYFRRWFSLTFICSPSLEKSSPETLRLWFWTWRNPKSPKQSWDLTPNSPRNWMIRNQIFPIPLVFVAPGHCGCAQACAASRLEAREFLHLQRWKFGKWRSSCGTQKIGTGANNSNFTMVYGTYNFYGTYNYSVHGCYKPSYNVWGPHIVC